MKYFAPFVLNGALIVLGIFYVAISGNEYAIFMALYGGLALGCLLNLGMSIWKLTRREEKVGLLYLALFLGCVGFYKLLGDFPEIGYHNP